MNDIKDYSNRLIYNIIDSQENLNYDWIRSLSANDIEFCNYLANTNMQKSVENLIEGSKLVLRLYKVYKEISTVADMEIILPLLANSKINRLMYVDVLTDDNSRILRITRNFQTSDPSLLNLNNDQLTSYVVCHKIDSYYDRRIKYTILIDTGESYKYVTLLNLLEIINNTVNAYFTKLINNVYYEITYTVEDQNNDSYSSSSDEKSNRPTLKFFNMKKVVNKFTLLKIYEKSILPNVLYKISPSTYQMYSSPIDFANELQKHILPSIQEYL